MLQENAGGAQVKALIEEILPPDGTAPNPTIATPTSNQVVTANPVNTTGTATDNLGVARRGRRDPEHGDESVAPG